MGMEHSDVYGMPHRRGKTRAQTRNGEAIAHSIALLNLEVMIVLTMPPLHQQIGYRRFVIRIGYLCKSSTSSATFEFQTRTRQHYQDSSTVYG